MQFAHLFPLEEGGHTAEDNLIPLCSGSGSCHWLYDKRYASVTEMTRARELRNAGGDNLELAARMRERLEQHRDVSTVLGDLEDMLQSEIAHGHFRKAARAARSLAKAPGSSAQRRIGY